MAEKQILTKEEIKFFDEVFLILLGSTKSEYDNKFTTIYQYELKELINSIKHDLTVLLDIYSKYTADDVERLFAIHFYCITGVLKDPKHLHQIALDFDKMFGNNLSNTYSW